MSSSEGHPMILLVGDSGTHKTYFCGTCPKPYIADFDGGLAILRNRATMPASDTFKDVPPQNEWLKTKRPGYYQYGKAWPAFIKKINEIGDQMDKGTCPYETLCIDSVTTMADVCMAYVINSDSKTTDGANPQIQHWGAQIQLLQTVFNQLNEWPINKVFTAHIQRNTNDLTQLIEMLPLVTGKLAGKIGVYFDEVWYTQVKGAGAARKWTAQTESGGLYKQAKTRFGVPDGTELHWEAVYPYISGEKQAVYER